jgi:hypothetical protein
MMQLSKAILQPLSHHGKHSTYSLAVRDLASKHRRLDIGFSRLSCPEWEDYDGEWRNVMDGTGFRCDPRYRAEFWNCAS